MDNTVLAEIFTKKGKLQKNKAKNELTKEVALNAQTKRKVAALKSRSYDSTSKPNKPAASIKSKIAERAAEIEPSKANNNRKYSVSKSKSGGRVRTIEEEEEASEATILERINRHMKAPMKKKRGADDEIAQACLSYANGMVPKLRPRKEVPAFRQVELGKDDDCKIVGKQVQVYWPDSKRWFTGRIMAFERRKKLHSILYKDGDKEELDLRKERFLLGVLPSEDFKLKAEPKSRKKIEVVYGTSIGADTMNKDSLLVSDADSVTGTSVTQYKRGSKKVANQMRSVLNRRSSALKKGEQVVPDAGVGELPEKTKKGPSRLLKKRGRSKGKATFSTVKRRKLDMANRKTRQKEEQQDTQLEVHAQDGANFNSVQGGLNSKEGSEDDLLKGSKKSEAPRVTARKGEEQMKRGETDGQMFDSASFRKNGNEMGSTRSKEVSSDLQTAALECPAGTLGVEHGKVIVERGECKRDRETLTFVRRKRY